VEGENRIIGGDDVAFPNKYPWMTRVLTTKPNGDKFSCGGSIVASKFILTAAHCLFKDGLQTMPSEPSDVEVIIGDHDTSSDTETTKQKTIQVAKVIIHEDYVSNVIDDMGAVEAPGPINDIALLELEEEIDLMDYTPVCLARAGINEAEMTPAHAYGWGATGPTADNCATPLPTPNILKETELRVCTEAESEFFPATALLDQQLCAVGATSTTYRGDSGGPLTIKTTGNQHVQVGDVSFGVGCPTLPLNDAKAVFGRISVLRGWLEGKMPGATTCSNGFDADTMLTRNWSGISRWRQQQQADTEQRRQEDVDKKRRKEEKMRRKAEKKKKKQEKKQKRKEEAAAAAAAAAAAEATTESAAEETTLQ